VVSGQLHTSATLVGLMESPVAIEQESRCASETLWMVWRKVSLSVPGIEMTIPWPSSPWPSHCTKHYNTPPPTSFPSCDNFSREKDTEGLPGQLRPAPGRRSHSSYAPQLEWQTKVCGSFIPIHKNAQMN
jgi:hypothetical protein